jgi:hypothetical protein
VAVYEQNTCLVEASTALSPKYCSSFKMLQGMMDKWCLDLEERKKLPDEFLPHKNVDFPAADKKPAAQ